LAAATILVAAKALSNAYGAYLLVEHRAMRILSVNGATVIFGILLAWFYQLAGHEWNLTSSLWVICLVELVCAALYSVSAFQTRILR
jgi:hypothetical protein